MEGGGLAQMVERSLSMREVQGSIPGFSSRYSFQFSLALLLFLLQELNGSKQARLHKKECKIIKLGVHLSIHNNKIIKLVRLNFSGS